jgi:glutathione S-transferase
LSSAKGTPRLYVFAISHYCEKARWALDFLDIDYRLEHLAPGAHIKLTRSLGLAHTALPVLQGDSFALQGSAQIVDWAEQNSGGERALTPEDADAAREIEQRLDDLFGVHVRRYYYSDALFSEPGNVKSIFTRDLSWRQALPLHLAWGPIRKHMIRGMDLGARQRGESRQIIENELDWLDGLLADGREHLLGGRFSRADLATASLLAPLALPSQHPTYNDLKIPDGIAADLEAWRDRPAISFTREIYRRYR